MRRVKFLSAPALLARLTGTAGAQDWPAAAETARWGEIVKSLDIHTE